MMIINHAIINKIINLFTIQNFIFYQNFYIYNLFFLLFLFIKNLYINLIFKYNDYIRYFIHYFYNKIVYFR